MKNTHKLKTYLLSFCIFIISVLFVVSVFSGLNIFGFNILSLRDITLKTQEVKLAKTNLELEKTKCDVLESKLNTEKQEFKTEKNKYEIISDETVDIINKLNTKEKYSIEYIWIKLGNYAKLNNLSIIVAEPGNTLNSEEKVQDDSIFKIQVSGSYISVASFIYNIENDDELKFKLDNIKMEYVSGVNIRATFDVKDIVIIK